jgi:hypothetical protein
MAAMDFTIALLSPGFVDGLSPTTMSFQEIFLGLTSLAEMKLNFSNATDCCVAEGEAVVVGGELSAVEGHEKHLLW